MTGVLRFPDGREVPVRDGAILGRVPQSDIQVADGKVSRRHARLIVAGGVVEVEDLDSSNGTYLNGKRVGKRMLRDGDVLRLGKVELTYRPAASGGAAKGAAAEVDVEDDVDLFGADAPATQAPEAPPPASAPAAPPAAAPGDDDVDLFGSEPEPAGRPPTPAQITPAAKPAPPEVVEFADEVVEVANRSAPEPAPKASSEPDVVSVGGKGKALQFSKVADRKGLANADLSQMPAWQRRGLVILAVAAALGAGYLAMQLAMA